MHAYADPPVFAECFGDRFQIVRNAVICADALPRTLNANTVLYEEVPRPGSFHSADQSMPVLSLPVGGMLILA